MKKFLKNAYLLGLLICSFLIPDRSKAATKNVTTRVNRLRNTIQEKVKKGDLVELTAKDFYNNGNIDKWVNWGNWGNWSNWNNWNNWAKWNDWSNWGNWGNWRNY